MNISTSINQKLNFSFFVIILLAALGSGYSFYLNQRSKAYIQYKEQVSTLLLHLKDARVLEKNFILYERKKVDFLEDGQSQSIIRHTGIINSINTDIEAMMRSAGGKDIQLITQLSLLKTTIKEYQRNFNVLKKLYLERGFKDHGLEGSMRNNVHDLQECFSTEEKVYAYALRRHEKDFMLRKDLTYYEKLKQTAAAFQLFVAKSVAPHMTSEYKRKTIRVIDEYTQKFGQLVTLEKEIGLTDTEGISGQLNEAAAALLPISESLFTYVDTRSDELQKVGSMFLIGSIFGIILIGFTLSYGINNKLVKPLLLLNNVIQHEIEGKSQKAELEKITNKDEIGKLTNNFLEMMNKLDIQLKGISEANNALKETSENDRIRKWIAEGVSAFVDLMKNNNNDVKEMAYQIISKLVKYIDANQGGIFFVDDLEKSEKMILAASYAYNRRKFLSKEVIKGEGLISAAWIEKQTIEVADIPQDYISLTSGLGDARPDKLIIVPIKNEDSIFGVIEMASFNAFQKHEIELIEKICDRLASTYESLKTQEKTKGLLQMAQMQTEELKAQEEEMRQNLEEMAATQEDFERREKELNNTIDRLLRENNNYKSVIDQQALESV